MNQFIQEARSLVSDHLVNQGMSWNLLIVSNFMLFVIFAAAFIITGLGWFVLPAIPTAWGVGYLMGAARVTNDFAKARPS